MDQYTFLLGSLMTLALYGVIYYRRADLQDQMEKFGVFVGLWSIGSSYFLWTQDWWQPMTVTGTIVGVEDFIFGFAIGGILIAGYEFFFQKKLKESSKYSDGWERTRMILTLFLSSFFITYTLLGFPSWLSWSISSILGAILIAYYREDLVKVSLGTGTIALAYSIVGYQVLLLYNPNFVQQTYLLDQLSGILFLGVPIEEYIWFFTSGCLVGPYYELYNEFEIIDC